MTGVLSGRATRTRGIGAPPQQTLALARTFLARFFDNEITGGTNDLLESFFWLVAFLAVPGIFASVMMSWGWSLTERLQGAEVLRISSASEKVFYLGYAMIAAGAITSVVWHSLLIDRRDAMVLGSLPVSHRVVVRGKLLALAAYVSIVAVSMHVLASMGFGVFLAVGRDLPFAARGVMAHFTASSLASLFVLAGATAIQGTVLSLIGPRAFARVSVALQFALVTVVVLGLLALPDIAGSAVDTVRGSGEHARPWVLATPPLWFLGIYEKLLGTGDPRFARLAQKGWTAIAAALGTAALTYPLAYRRVMRDAVEHPGGLGRMRAAMLARWLPVTLARHGTTRAAVQFLVSTIGRMERHRFTLALAGGTAIAWSTPTIVRWHALVSTWSAADRRAVLSLPVAIMVCMLVGLRVASALPGDLRARWLFQAVDPPPRRARAGLRRVMLAVVVLPAAIAAAALGSLLWSASIAARHALFTAAAGLLVAECLSRDLDSIPCATPWRPEHANLRTWWPAYLIAFVVLCGTSPISLASLELWSFQDATANAVLIGFLVLAAGFVHWRSTHRGAMPVEEPETFNAVGVLDLN